LSVVGLLSEIFRRRVLLAGFSFLVGNFHASAGERFSASLRSLSDAYFSWPVISERLMRLAGFLRQAEQRSLPSWAVSWILVACPS
jgi:hypothetical protein